MKEECMCAKILGYEPERFIYVHLTGCPEDYSTKEYDKLSWWQKIIQGNPRRIYKIHKRQIGV